MRDTLYAYINGRMDNMERNWDEWDELYGDDSDDGFDACRDFGGDIDEARRSFEDEE
jgi:hypothetical protein